MLSEVPFCHLLFKMKIEEKVLLAECNRPSISVFHWLFPNAALSWTQRIYKSRKDNARGKNIKGPHR